MVIAVLPSTPLAASQEDSYVYVKVAPVVFIRHIQKMSFACLPRRVVLSENVSLVRLSVRTRHDGSPHAITVEYGPNSRIGTYLSESVKSWRFRPVVVDSARHPAVSKVLVYIIRSQGKPYVLVAGYHQEAVRLQYCEY